MRDRSQEDGASAVEYGLLVAGIAALVVAVVFALGGAIGGLFSDSCGTVASHMTSATCGP
jgi:pilus assembly protein Flp/PilA